MSPTPRQENTTWKMSEHDVAIALEKMTKIGPGKQEFVFNEKGLVFSSQFDGGNLQHVEQIDDCGQPTTFHLRVAEDASAFGISTGYTTWFYFEIHGMGSNISDDGKNRREIRLVLLNMNPQRGLYTNGYTVMFAATDKKESDAIQCVFEDETQWKRLPTPLQFEKYVITSTGNSVEPSEDDEGEGGNNTQPVTTKQNKEPAAKKVTQETKMKISFTYKFKSADERVRFAFCYPFTYTRVQRELAVFDQKYTVSATHQNLTPKSPSISATLTRPRSQSLPSTAATSSPTIYYHRELLARSLGGLRIDLLTISSYDGITSTREPIILPQLEKELPQLRAFQFDVKKKKTVFITARVHPGETPANFMLNGMMQLLLHPTDERARSLRRHFVFKIIPILNPDGVCQGFYRTDLCGVNLNRVYEAPTMEFSPSVFATKAVMAQIVNEYGGAHSVTAQENVIYLDLHAHANRRGCFVYGNYFLSEDEVERHNSKMKSNGSASIALTKQVETQLFARLVSLHTPYFDYLACSFDKANMTRNDLRDNNNATTSRQGSSRVALYQATGLVYVYTIECNYNEGRKGIRPSTTSSSSSGVQSSSASTSKINLNRPAVAPVSANGRLYTKYSPTEWTDVGTSAVLALLDLFQLPGRSKTVAESPYRSLDGIRKSLWAEIKPAFDTSKSETIISKNTLQTALVKHAPSKI